VHGRAAVLRGDRRHAVLEGRPLPDLGVGAAGAAAAGGRRGRVAGRRGQARHGPRPARRRGPDGPAGRCPTRCCRSRSSPTAGPTRTHWVAP
jgi:hypothetical protein